MVQHSTPLSNTPEAAEPKRMWQDVDFQYTGGTALTIKGSITGKLYRFVQPNSIQKIDYRDASGMMAVPVLRKINRNA